MPKPYTIFYRNATKAFSQKLALALFQGLVFYSMKKACILLVFIVFWLFLTPAYGANKAWQRVKPAKTSLFFSQPFSDLPLIHNYMVEQWIRAFQSVYSKRFRIWLERSYRYGPLMRHIFREQNIPVDLVYLCMIESGFLAHAVSSAGAVGYWQFIQPTALRFGLRKNYWLDERKDFEKSALAASQYLKVLYRQFGSWWLAVSAYNMGENKLSRLVKKHKTKNIWRLIQKHDFPLETARYVPQLIAAITIAKAPALYGFQDLKIQFPLSYDIFYLPGGTNLRKLAAYIDQPYMDIKALNPALIGDHIPEELENWRTRVPKGTVKKISQYVMAGL